MRLAHFIVTNSEAIFSDWKKFTSTLVLQGKKNDHVLLNDHIKIIIEDERT